MNELQVFSFEEKRQVRTVVINENPWFVAKDVCDILGHSNSRKALQMLDNDEKGVTSSYTLGGRQNVNIVNEPGLYRLIFQSRKLEAEVFKRWIFHEVLPSIRKAGVYNSQKSVLEDYGNQRTKICELEDALGKELPGYNGRVKAGKNIVEAWKQLRVELYEAFILNDQIAIEYDAFKRKTQLHTGLSTKELEALPVKLLT